MTYRHPSLGFTLEVPEGWRAAGDVPPIFMPEDAEQYGFAPNLVVTSGEPGKPAAVAGALAHAWLIDADDAHVLLHHLERGLPTVLEQWWTERDGRSWVISASCGPLDYDALADTFAAVAGSLRLP